MIKAQPSCNIFPKIFGGTVGHSFLHQIDVYNEYLAMAGDTYDIQLAGSSLAISLPYIAL